VAGKLQNEEALQPYRGLRCPASEALESISLGSAHAPNRNDALPAGKGRPIHLVFHLFPPWQNITILSGSKREAVKLVGHETVGSAGRKHLRSYKFSQQEVNLPVCHCVLPSFALFLIKA
jgi:hypothetical protein